MHPLFVLAPAIALLVACATGTQQQAAVPVEAAPAPEPEPIERPRLDQRLDRALVEGVEIDALDEVDEGLVGPVGIPLLDHLGHEPDPHVADRRKAERDAPAGADEVGGDELAEKVRGGWLDFDVVIGGDDFSPKVAGTVTNPTDQSIDFFTVPTVR